MKYMKSKILLATCVLGAQALTACSMAEPDSGGKHIISVSLPAKTSASRFAMATIGDNSSATYTGSDTPDINYDEGSESHEFKPQSFADFNCFAINVRGPGVPLEPRMRCGDPRDAMGVFVGLVPRGGQIDVAVPAGADREIELIGVGGEKGCPNINEILDPNFDPRLKYGELSEPYLLAKVKVDIFEDREVALKVSFDPANPKYAFQSCDDGNGGDKGPSEPGWGPEVPLIAAHGFQLTVPNPTPSASPTPAVLEAQVFDGNVSLFPAAAPSPVMGWASGLETKTQAELDAAKLRLLDESGYPNHGMGHALGVNSVGYRAALQMHFDMTAVDFARYPIAALNMRIRGGGIGANGALCAGANQNDPEKAMTVNVGVLNAASSTGNNSADMHWMPLNRFAEGASWAPNRKWGWGGGQLLQLPLSEMVLNRDGKKLLLVNVESNASTHPSCFSAVRVADVHLRLRESPMSMGGQQLMMESSAKRVFAQVSGAGGGMQMPSFAMPAAGWLKPIFYVYGSSSPVNFSIIGNNGTGTELVSIDGMSGKVTLGSNSISGSVTIQASNGSQSASAKLFIAPSNLPVGVKFTGTSPQLTVENCTSFSMVTVNVDGNPTAVGSNTTIELTQSGNGAFYNASCGTQIANSHVIMAGSSSITVWYKPSKVSESMGMGPAITEINASYPAGSTMIFSMPYRFTVVPGPAVKYLSELPPVIADGYCTPFKVYAADANDFKTNVGSNDISTVYHDKTSAMLGLHAVDQCQDTPMTSQTLNFTPAIQEQVLYLKPTAAQFYNLGANSSTTLAPFLGNNMLVRPATQPVKFGFTVPAGASNLGVNTCQEIQIKALKADGTAANLGSNSIIAYVKGLPQDTAYPDSTNCSGNTGSLPQLDCPGPNCRTQVSFGANTDMKPIWVKSNWPFMTELKAFTPPNDPLPMSPAKIQLEFKSPPPP